MLFYLTESSGRHVTGNDAGCDFYNPGASPGRGAAGRPTAGGDAPGPAGGRGPVLRRTEVSAAPSTGHLGRSFKSYVWTAVAADTLGDNAMLAAEARALDTPVFGLTGDDLSVVGAYVDVKVSVENWLGAWDTSDAFRIRVTAGLPPSVEIIGGISQTYRRMDAVSVMAQGIDGLRRQGLIQRAVNYTWALAWRPGVDVADERFYKLPPYALDVSPTS